MPPTQAPKGAAHGPAATRSAPRSILGAVVAALASGVLGVALAPLGTKALYGVAAVFGVLVIGYLTHDVLGPPLRDAVDRVRPERFPTASEPSGWRHGVRATVLTVTAGVAAWMVAQQGMKAVLGVVALLLGLVALWLLFPIVQDLVRTPPADVPARRRAAAPVGDGGARPAPVSRAARAVGATCTVVAAGVLAWAAAHMGLKGLIALVGLIGAVSLLAYVRDRSVFFTFAAVSSLTFVLHKSFSSQDLVQSGGAISIYITTFDAVLLLLYGIWIAEGTFVADLRRAFRRRILFLPLVGALFLLPSLLSAPSLLHSASELFRMVWMYLLFVYVAVRVRTRRHVWAVLGGLAVFAVIEFVVVILQAKTGGVLGLSFLGVPKQLGERVTDTSVIGRPFGTIIHPVFMGAVMGSLALFALSMGVTLKRSATKLAALALVVVCLGPLYLAHTRAALVAFAMIALVVLAVAVVHRHLEWSTIGKVVLVLLVGVVLFWPQLSGKFLENFSTGHFTEEVDSRRELNDIAGEMIDDHPVTGVGLNNFELVMGPYEKYGIIFFNNPVHNLYLLYLAETGIVGFAGVVLVGVGLYNVAVRLARAPDRLLGGVGLGVSAVMAFLMVEELLGFSLRQDIPLAMYWLLAGLAVSCSRLAGFDGGREASSRRTLRPPRPRVRSAGRPGTDELERSLALHRAAVTREHDLAARARVTFLSRLTVSSPSRWLDELVTMPLVEPTWLDELALMAATSFSGRDDDAGEVRPAPDGRGSSPRSRGNRSPGSTTGSRGSWRLRGAMGGLCFLAVAALLPFAAPTEASSTEGLRITFTATDRATGIQGIYTANGDGTAVVHVTPSDHRTYSWAQWAFGGTKIIYTVRDGPEGSPEDLYLMNPDGSAVQLVQRFEYRIGQPKVAPDGRSVVFTAQVPWFPEVGLFRLDLASLEATNLSAVTAPLGSVDADPMFTPSGTHLVLATSDLVRTQINMMRTDGSERVALTADDHFNTDPDVSPDERQVVSASYRGDGNPGTPGKLSVVGVKPQDWFLVVRDLADGSERVLTQGARCVERTEANPCRPDEASAYKPRWTPDGREIGYNATLDGTHTCICVIGADGSNARAIISRADLALDWFDWIIPSGRPVTAADPGSAARRSALLLTMSGGDGIPHLVAASPDLMHRTPLALPAGLVPESARWTADHGTIVFTARVPVPEVRPAPHPAAPAGETRREHFTLDELDPILAQAEPPSDGALAERQVFVRDASGAVTQLTDVSTEDWRDGLVEGDARGNTDPVISPDGRYVVFTNTSTRTTESFLLRLDRQTGEVLNLTNGTAGAVKVDDAHPQFSPDGRQLTFTWANGGATDVYTMDAADGRSVTAVTSDDFADISPTFTADGRGIVYASYRGEGSPLDPQPDGTSKVKASGWVLVRVDVATRQQLVLSDAASSPTWQPVVAPEGDRLLYVGVGSSSINLFAVAPDGQGRRLLQPDPHQNHLTVDWK
jgi:Tol biopolymer transport system component/O-antigen ligase